MRGRWLAVGLVASLALNLFLIGAAAGVIALGARMARQNIGARPGAFARAARALPEPERRDLRLMLRAAWIQIRPVATRSRQLRLAGWDALADPKPDAAAIKARLAQSRQLDASTRAAVEEKLVDYVMALPPHDRAAFVAGLDRAFSPPGSKANRPGAPAKGG
ncbi:MAG TPA: periplasmic heavy metal sensor [Caulobacteraceae bacterium]|nr:periplasmic heavy metal sensor [Caulobacteraceae bacterium]